MVISRDVLRVLALVDISISGRRVLDILLALSDPETGAVEITQNEMCLELGASKPTVNRSFKELRECGLAWAIKKGFYQLHPALTGGRVSSPVVSVPEIRAAEPARLATARRDRYAARLANLASTA